MVQLRPLIFCSLAALLIPLAGCKQSMVISDVNYSQPIETVLVPDNEGMVQDLQHGLTFNILPLQYEETQDSSSVTTTQVRMIRGYEGYYYITAAGYSHVYIMAPEKSSLKLTKKIKISEDGLEEPAFNQRKTYVQLLNRKTNTTYALTDQGLNEAEGNDEEQNEEEGSQ